MKAISNKALVLILTIGVFGILNTEMGIVGVIPYVSKEFGVSIPDAGLLVSGFALIVAIAGPTMPLLFSRINRKKVMILSLSVFSVCNVVSIFAPNFEVLLAARVIPAAFHPLYVSMAMAIAQHSGDTPEECAKASPRGIYWRFCWYGCWCTNCGYVSKCGRIFCGNGIFCGGMHSSARAYSCLYSVNARSKSSVLWKTNCCS